jgi:hypothetical protein
MEFEPATLLSKRYMCQQDGNLFYGNQTEMFDIKYSNRRRKPNSLIVRHVLVIFKDLITLNIENSELRQVNKLRHHSCRLLTVLSPIRVP